MLIKLVPTKKTPLSLFPFYFLDTIEIRLKRATSIRTKKEKLKSIIRSRLTDITSSISLSVGSVVRQANHLDFPWLLLWLLVKFKSFSRFFEFPMINSNFLSSFLFHHPLVQIHPVFKILWKWMKWWKKGLKNFESFARKFCELRSSLMSLSIWRSWTNCHWIPKRIPTPGWWVACCTLRSCPWSDG